jgi:hypothetical protein
MAPHADHIHIMFLLATPHAIFQHYDLDCLYVDTPGTVLLYTVLHTQSSSPLHSLQLQADATEHILYHRPLLVVSSWAEATM